MTRRLTSAPTNPSLFTQSPDVIPAPGVSCRVRWGSDQTGPVLSAPRVVFMPGGNKKTTKCDGKSSPCCFVVSDIKATSGIKPSWWKTTPHDVFSAINVSNRHDLPLIHVFDMNRKLISPDRPDTGPVRSKCVPPSITGQGDWWDRFLSSRPRPS